MKKLLIATLLGCMTLSCVACTNTEKKEETNKPGQEQQVDNPENPIGEEPAGGEEVSSSKATDMFKAVWNKFPEEQKFPAFGGDTENMVDDAPGVYDITKAEDLGMETTLCFPAGALDLIDDASVLTHGMLSNNFTGAIYHVTDAANTQTVVEGIKTATLNNRWMCGFPEKLVVVTIGEDYVASAFGLNDSIEAFKTSLVEAHGDSVKVVVEESLSE